MSGEEEDFLDHIAASLDTISPRFCDSNADLTLQSSDGVLFKVFSKDLEAYSGGFPSTEIVKPALGEVVSLAETSGVLDLLLQYMRRQRQPDIKNVKFDILALLAEAVEKYEVYSATEICKIYMTAAIPEHSIEVLGYAMKHGYPELGDQAAPKSIGSSLAQAQKVLSTDILLAWVQYRECWLNVLDRAHHDAHVLKHAGGVSECAKWRPFREQILTRLGARPHSLQQLTSIFELSQTAIMLSDCYHCLSSATIWRKKIETELRGLPSFSTFL